MKSTLIGLALVLLISDAMAEERSVTILSQPTGANVTISVGGQDSHLGYSGQPIRFNKELFIDPKGKSLTRTLTLHLKGHKSVDTKCQWGQLEQSPLGDDRGLPINLEPENFFYFTLDHWGAASALAVVILAVFGTLSLKAGQSQLAQRRELELKQQAELELQLKTQEAARLQLEKDRELELKQQAEFELELKTQEAARLQLEKDRELERTETLKRLANIEHWEEGNSFNRLGNYYILRKLGSGAMGEVKLACKVDDLSPTGLVAIKQIQLPNQGDTSLESAEEYAQRQALFERESRHSLALNHPNVVRILECSTEPSKEFMVMQYIRGHNLTEEIKKFPKGIPLPLALPIMLALCRGLEAIHQHQLIHRDIKPDNIMLSATGEIIIVDLGMTRKIDNDLETGFKTGFSTQDTFYNAKGSMQYWSPELFGEAAASIHKKADVSKILNYLTDQYAMGLVYFEILTGEFPRAKHDFMAVTMVRQSTNLTEYKADLPMDVIEIVHRMLSELPEQRFASMSQVAKALELVESRNG